MLSVKNLSVTFTMYDVGLTQKQLTVITDLDLEVNAGEVVAVVGSSGSGKSLLAHAILGILPHNAQVTGQIIFQGEPLTVERQAQLRGKQIALIPQSISYLDPLMRVGSQVNRAGHLSGLPKIKAKQQVDRVFDRYGLATVVKQQYPFQISGGMARRVLVATAAIGCAELLIADEPTPGLHPEIVVETLNHLRELASEGKGVILITHDLEAALQVADKVAVFYAGTTLEVAKAGDFTSGNLRHPYTQALWRSLPQNEFIPVPGSQPSPEALPVGCLFGDRCPLATETCLEARPQVRIVRGAPVRCIHVEG
ncbi:Oligopeptide/dipeptide ABC transporter, ATP-binding protein-like protein (plasmid) [Trichormus variabilis ATCC 29413]|uniref:Nickel import system ATP-binding protein NikD n=2 Tax=Anabaena variabilis TaxID=264691 RepID=Q3M1P0_TRIV2|nr:MULTISPECIES: ABC transporter ATP-binding protein [Nostocaceae]PMB25774.1 ABC transporter ATP-binding protein [Fischerella thermalis CCMEE 5319]ABA25103.1 Oligopeptide/dipeptide ABC transporter, ATP-binding protein-like protein [Trichormus variabilis ATCC 29413]MBC1218246.1 ABC transporter ATP-binding protein [Trichormus variabilis ARAD]MBC1271077.1 ABC transporter ATP-binding protein [Trichormus variabilis FSR]MBC1305990.1 ABC transporter ATP-binding protein [Trichormus variabilis N2B]